MPSELLLHAGRRYAVKFTYAVPDDAWYVELSEAIPAPESGAGIPGTDSHLPGPAFMTAIVPDEGPTREPTITILSAPDRLIPYVVMRWFMQHVADEVARSRSGVMVRGGSAEKAEEKGEVRSEP
jgi:hypothetical protein